MLATQENWSYYGGSDLILSRRYWDRMVPWVTNK